MNKHLLLAKLKSYDIFIGKGLGNDPDNILSNGGYGVGNDYGLGNGYRYGYSNGYDYGFGNGLNYYGVAYGSGCINNYGDGDGDSESSGFGTGRLYYKILILENSNE